MSEIRLYKKFYQVAIVRTGQTVDQRYSLMDPISLSANTFIAGPADAETTVSVETSVPIAMASQGIYYARLEPSLYISDVTYDLVWYVNYTSGSGTKKLSSRFRFNINRISHEIEVEIYGQGLEVEIIQQNLDIEIN